MTVTRVMTILEGTSAKAASPSPSPCASASFPQKVKRGHCRARWGPPWNKVGFVNPARDLWAHLPECKGVGHFGPSSLWRDSETSETTNHVFELNLHVGPT